MTTSAQERFLSEIASENPISEATLAYLYARLQNRFYDFILTKFDEAARGPQGLTKAKLARRIGKSPEVITRLLGAPGNWTLETASALMVGIAREEIEPSSRSISDRAQRNYQAPDWLSSGEKIRQFSSVSHGFLLLQPNRSTIMTTSG